MKNKLSKLTRWFAITAAAAILLPAALRADEVVTPSHQAPLYIYGQTLTVSFTFAYPADRELWALLWRPELPAGWTLLGAEGDGDPLADSVRNEIVFFGNWTDNPVTFTYTVGVPDAAAGVYSIGGSAEYLLDDMVNESIVPLVPIVMSDASATHDAIGYLAGANLTVDCSFSWSAGLQLQSLLWRPVLPDGWTLLGATGNDPLLDLDGVSLVFFGDLSVDPVKFSYVVAVPAGATLPQNIGSEIEYQLESMTNPYDLAANPNPLVLQPRHTLEIKSAYGTADAAVGAYTNFFGTVLTNSVTASVIENEGRRIIACTGWTLDGNEPATGTTNNFEMTVAHNAILTWNWAAPEITAPAADGVVGVTMDEDGVPTAWAAPVVSAAARAYPDTSAKGILAWSLVSGPTHGSAEVSGTGASPTTFTYTPFDDYNGADSFVIKVVNGLGGSETVTVNVTVNAINDAPVAVLDNFNIDEGGTLNGDVRSNDFDIDTLISACSAMLVDNVTHGSLTLNTNGTFTYVHDGSETISDSFTYHLNDGALDGNTVTVSLTINPVNDAPECPHPITDYELQQDFEAFTITLTNVFADDENNALAFTAASSNPGVVAATVLGNILTLSYGGTPNQFSTITVIATETDTAEKYAVTNEFKVTVQRVHNQTQNKFYDTILLALAEAGANDVIIAAAGSYTGDHSVNVPLTLKGPAAGYEIDGKFTFNAKPVTVSNATLANGNIWEVTGNGSIQDAVDASSADDTVNVLDGTFVEAVTVDKAISLIGANSGTSACGGTRGDESVIKALTGTALTITAAGVVVDGFSVNALIGILAQNVVDFELINNAVTASAVGIRIENAAGAPVSSFVVKNNAVTLTQQIINLGVDTPTVGIAIGGVLGITPPTIEGNCITNGHCGYVLFGIMATAETVIKGGTITGVLQGISVLNTDGQAHFAPSHFAVQDVVMTGFAGTSTVVPSNFHAGVYVFTTGSDPAMVVSGALRNVTVDGTGAPGADSAGLYFSDFSGVASPMQSISVEECSIINNANRGLFANAHVKVTVSRSTLSNNGHAPFGDGGNYAFGVLARLNADVSLSETFITNPASVTGGYPVTALAVNAGTLPMKVVDCSLANNGSGTLAAGPIEASANWWGSADPAAVKSMASNEVDYTPWFAVGTDTAATAGFQPDYSVLWVDDDGLQTGSTNRIQEGVNLVSATGIVNVAAGTYNEALSINKPIAVVGAGKNLTTITQGVTLTARKDGTASMQLRDLSVVAADSVYIVDTVYAIRLDATEGNTAPVILSNVLARSPLRSDRVYGAGLFITPNGNVVDNVAISGCTLDGSWTQGIFVKNSTGTQGALTHLVVTDTTLDNNRVKKDMIPSTNNDFGFGLYVLAANTNPSLKVDDVAFMRCSFNGHFKGVYAEALSNAKFEQVIATDCWREGFDLNLKWDDYENLAFVQSELTGNNQQGGNYPDLHIKGRNDGAPYGANPASISGVTVERSVVGYASFGNSVNDLSVHSSGLNVLWNYTSPGAAVNAESNWWGSATGPTHASNPGGTGGVVGGGPADYSPWLGRGDSEPATIGFQPYTDPLYYLPVGLKFDPQPMDAALGATLATVTVTVTNEIGGVALQFTNAVTLAIGNNPGFGVLTGTVTVPCTAGVASFADLAVTLDGGIGFTLQADALTLSKISDPFDIDNPMPSLGSMSPIFAAMGSGDLTLTLTGSNFVGSSVVMWGTTTLTPTSVTAGQITVGVPANLLAAAGTADITVFSPAAGGGTSGTLIFNITSTALAPIVYVDKTWSGYGLCGGHVWGYDAFNTIQTAINGVENGGKIYVHKGTYEENAASPVGKKIALISGIPDGADLPTIHGSLTLNKDDGCVLENIRFLVKDNGTLTQNALTLNTVNGLTVQNCVFDGNGLFLTGKNGITGSGNSNITVENCLFTNGLYCAISAYINNLTVKDSTIVNVKSGINLQKGDNLVVQDCDISVIAQGDTDSYGIRFANTTPSSTGLTITGCNISSDLNGQIAKAGEYHCAIYLRAKAAGTLKIANCNIDGGVVNLSDTATLDASGNWWGGNDQATITAKINAANNGQFVDYSPWLNVGTDTDEGAIGFKGDFAALWVDDDSPQVGEIGRIQEGVNAVSTSGTVYVAAGEYIEQVEISKAMVLQGTGQAATTIKAFANMPLSFTAPRDLGDSYTYTYVPIVYVHDADAVKIYDLTIDGDKKGARVTNDGLVGLGGRNAGMLAKDVTVIGITDIVENNAYGYGIFAYADDVQSNRVELVDCTVTNFQQDGIVIDGTAVEALVSGCTVTCSGVGFFGQYGIQIKNVAHARIENNTVQGVWEQVSYKITNGILVLDSARTEIVSNKVLNCNIPLEIVEGDHILIDNTISGGTVSYITEVKSSVISGGTFSGTKTGIQFQDNRNVSINGVEFAGNNCGLMVSDDYDGSDVVVEGCVFTDNTEAALWVEDSGSGISPLVAVHGSSFTGNGTAIFSDSNDPVNAVSNWWGDATGPYNDVDNPYGVAAGVSNNVVIAQWYSEVAMTNLVPYALSLNGSVVDELAPVGTPVGTLSSTDVDGGAPVYTLVSGNGVNDAGNASFTIVGNKLQTAVVLDFETQSEYKLFAQVDDGNGGRNWAALTITVIDVNDAPVSDGTISNQFKQQDFATYTVLADLNDVFSDQDGDTLTFTASVTPAGLVVPTVNGTGLTLSSVATQNGSAVVTVRAEDPDGAFAETSFTVTVKPVLNTTTLAIFDSIQDAINADETLDGHTISVANGNYVGDVVLNKAVAVVAKDAGYSVTGNVTFDAVASMGGATISGVWYVTDNGTIQSAVDAASAGNTINVGAGTYNEHVVINKKLTVLGAGSNLCEVNGTNSGVVVTLTGDAHNSIFSGFTVKNGSKVKAEQGASIGLVGVNNCLVSDCVISDSFFGIALVASSNNTLQNNTISNVGFGIVAVDSDMTGSGVATGVCSLGNKIIGNEIGTIAVDGIYIALDCDGHTITSNTVSATAGPGIHLWKSDGHIVTDNTVTGSLDAGIRVQGSANNVITGNTLTGNAVGLVMHSSEKPASNCEVKRNNISGNTIGMNVEFGQYYSGDPLSIAVASNWWGKADGPAGVGPGSGDTIVVASSYTPSGATEPVAVDVSVDFTPWYTEVAMNNLVPYGIAMDSQRVAENLAVGTVVGAFITTDDDAGETFTYTLVAGAGDTDNASFAIDGAELTTTAIFDYEAKGTYTMRVQVSDNRNGLYETNFVITVDNINDAPVLAFIGNTNVNEQVSLTFPVTASDQDNNTLTFSLDATSELWGMSIGAASGVFTWDPTEEQGDAVYTVTVTVTDNGLGALSHSQDFTITVVEANVAPVLASIGNQSVNRGTELAFIVSATDQDHPIQELTYMIDSGAAALGMSIDSASGLFSWTPAMGTALGDYPVTVTVTDDGDNPANLFDEITFTNTVTASEQFCAGFRSPSDNMIVSNVFVVAAGATIESLSWTPILPDGWSLNTASGEAAPAVNGDTVVFTGPFDSNIVHFQYTVNVPGNQAVSNQVAATATFKLATMAAPQTVQTTPVPLVVYRYHSADYQVSLRVIDSTEINRVLSYWRAGAYRYDVRGYDGYISSKTGTDANTLTKLHSADYGTFDVANVLVPGSIGNGMIDYKEVLRVQAYWRNGGYSVMTTNPDGYTLGSTGPGPAKFSFMKMALTGSGEPETLVSGPATYNPGQSVTLVYSFNATDTLFTLGFCPRLPQGWTLLSVAGNGSPEIQQGAVVFKENPMPQQIVLNVTVQVPLNEIRTCELGNTADYWQNNMGDMATLNAVPWVMAPADSNGDGIADAWAAHYAMIHGAALDPDIDYDGDSHTVRQEYLSGTDPLNINSVLKMLTLVFNPEGTVDISWASEFGRIYTLQRADSSLSNFEDIATDLAADPSGRNHFEDDVDTDVPHFYRVILQ